MKTGIELIAEERKRQIEKEEFGELHDDGHDRQELSQAAAAYTLTPLFDETNMMNVDGAEIPALWPFGPQWWKPEPNDRIKELTKAGALIAAEIDRLQRAKSVTP